MSNWLLSGIIIGIFGLFGVYFSRNIPNIPERPHPGLGIATLTGMLWVLLGIGFILCRIIIK